MLENLDEASTLRNNFEPPGLESEDFGEAITGSVKEAIAEEPDTPAPDNVQ